MEEEIGFGFLAIGTHSWIYDGFRYAIPWYVAWFIIHSGTFVGMFLMAKGIIG